jgi:hypothetical protein
VKGFFGVPFYWQSHRSSFAGCDELKPSLTQSRFAVSPGLTGNKYPVKDFSGPALNILSILKGKLDRRDADVLVSVNTLACGVLSTVSWL